MERSGTTKQSLAARAKYEIALVASRPRNDDNRAFQTASKFYARVYYLESSWNLAMIARAGSTGTSALLTSLGILIVGVGLIVLFSN